jgi:hypothetical protein
MNRAFSADVWQLPDYLGRCPRLTMKGAPLALLSREQIALEMRLLVMPRKSLRSTRPNKAS